MPLKEIYKAQIIQDFHFNKLNKNKLYFLLTNNSNKAIHNGYAKQITYHNYMMQQ